MKNCILSILLFLSSSAFANDPWAELTGDAARKRTAEARERTAAMRASIAAANQEIFRKRAEIEAERAEIERNKIKMQSWRSETIAFVGTEVKRTQAQTEQIGSLLNSLKDQQTLVQDIQKAYVEYANNAIRCSKAAQGAVLLSRLAIESKLSSGVLILSYLSAKQEKDPQQQAALTTLAWEHGREALSSVDPLSQRLESTLNKVADQINPESLTQTMALLTSTAEGLQVQLDRAQSLYEGSAFLSQAYSTVQNEMMNGK